MILPGVLAHVPVGLYSLPVPLYAILGAAVIVVTASFGLIYLRPPTVRDNYTDEGYAVPPPVIWLLTAIGFVYLGFVIGVGWFGRQEVAAVNAASLLFWVYTIPFLPVAHVFIGGMYEFANPFAFIARMVSGGRTLAGADKVLERLGYWPAVVMLFLLVFAESISTIVQKPVVLGIGMAVYATAQVVLGVLFGENWYRGGDVFHAMTALASTIAPAALQRDSRGRVRLVLGIDPARFLPRLRGREALITLWLAGVLADGVRATPIWRSIILPPTEPFFESLGTFYGFDIGSVVEITLEILFTWIAFAIFFWVFVMVANGLAGYAAPKFGPGLDLSAGQTAAIVSPSLIPIALAYLFAHNLTQILAVGPLIITARNAPVTQLGLLTADQIRRISPGIVWWVQVGAIVLGHVWAVVMAHARLHTALTPATARLGAAVPSPQRKPSAVSRQAMAATAPRRHLEEAAFLADLGWLSAMVIYTATSLWILAQPITASGR